MICQYEPVSGTYYAWCLHNKDVFLSGVGDTAAQAIATCLGALNSYIIGQNNGIYPA